MPTFRPLTPCQQLLWRSQTASPSCPLFNQVVSIELPPAHDSRHDASTWARAWRTVQQRHAVLTTRIQHNEQGLPTQSTGNATTELEHVRLNDRELGPAQAWEQWLAARMQRVLPLTGALTDAAYVSIDGGPSWLYLNMHHLIADAWSTVQIWQTLQTCVNNPECTVEDSVEQTATFEDYLTRTRWPDSSVQQTPPDRQIAFYDHVNQRPDTRSTRFDVPLTFKEVRSLNHRGSQSTDALPGSDITKTAWHLALFAIYLHRVSGDEQIVIELPLSGRFGKTWRNVAGNFIEIIQVSVTVQPWDTIESVSTNAAQALLAQLKRTAPGCTASLPSGTVHGVLNVITAQIHSEESASNEPSRHLRWHHTGHSDMRHPLRLHVAQWNAAGKPNLSIDVNHASFTETARQRIPEHLAAVYRASLDDSTQEIRTLNMLCAEECWALHGLASTSPRDEAESLDMTIARMADKHAENMAVTDGSRCFSYAQLRHASDTVCQHLLQRDIGSGDRVAVLMSRSVELPAVLLGILASGASYIPIDIAQPDSRVQSILANANVKAIVVDTNRSKTAFTAPCTLTVGTIIDAGVLPMTSVEATTTSAGNERTMTDAAYIMYTSGSTGTPKGVEVSHHALMSYLEWATSYYDMPDGISMPLFTSVGFDLTVTSLYLPLLSGGTVHVHPQSLDTDALSVLSVVKNSRINTIKLTPAHLALLLETEIRLDGLTQLIIGGEDLKDSTAVAIHSRTDDPLRIVNEYGPTEATVGCITHVWKPGNDGGSVPIGKPIDGMSAYVLNEHDQPQFEGVAGELYLAGHSLASGYWKDSEQTAEAFVTCPCLGKTRLYKTGDLVRIEHDKLVYLGRKDTQVSLQGYRIELSDIESMAMQHPEVLQSVVRLVEPSGSHRTTRPVQSIQTSEKRCIHCGLSSRYPESAIDNGGLCSLCRHYLPNKARIDAYFRTPDDLNALVKKIKSGRRGQYDAVMLLSGGKDSTYALSKLVDLGLRIYAFSLDNGYISEQALANIDAVCQQLGVDHHYARTEHMDAIFHDSLTRYSNVCHGCFKTIYNLSMQFAEKHDIDTIFTGLSRGQLFETRLNNELFSDTTIPLKRIDDMVVAARVQYHAIQDAPHELLGINAVNNGTLPASIDIVDFYRYWAVEMADMLSYLEKRLDWVRPPDTGRSTNCLINDVGIYVHKLEQGFHNYALPYSWDVRLGHKARDEAINELEDEIDEPRVTDILHGINYAIRPAVEVSRPDSPLTSLTMELCYTSKTDLDEVVLRRWLEDHLPSYMLPAKLHRLQAMPLNLHGKIDRDNIRISANPSDDDTTNETMSSLNQTESRVARLWKDHVSATSIQRTDNFFKLGGDSQAAIRCVMELRRQGFDIEPAELFRHPELARFANVLDQAASLEVHDKQHSEPSAGVTFSQLSDSQREKLSQLLNRQATGKS